jgi:hypothetical protein
MPTPPPADFDRAIQCHELNTSLTVIQARAQLLLRQIDQGRLEAGNLDWIAQGLTAIVSATGRLGSLVDGLCAPAPNTPQAETRAGGKNQSARAPEGGGR